MKKIVTTILIAIAFTGSVFAQKYFGIDGYHNEDINTVFKKEKRDGFYWGYSTGYSPINNDNGLVFTTRGGWIMDHWFSFGIAGAGFVNNFDNLDLYSYQSSGSSDIYSLVGGYGGFYLGPILFPLKPVHLSFPVVFGVGAAAKINNYYYNDFVDNGDLFYLVEPGIELEVNFTKWMRIAFFGTYRIASEINILNIAPMLCKIIP